MVGVGEELQQECVEGGGWSVGLGRGGERAEARVEVVWGGEEDGGDGGCGSERSDGIGWSGCVGKEELWKL